MLGRSSRSRNFFKKLVVNGVNNSKAAIQNDCLMRLYDADAELKAISSELDSFDGKKDPIRCNLLVNQLRTAQDKVISLLFQLMDDCNCERASRDYRMKFPDEILLSEGSESLNGQIWFGAECLSAGSNILNHTKESTMLRPMAKTLTQHLDSLRNDLRDLVIDGGGASRINHALIKKMVAFDHIFATFEYEYVRTMLPIRTVTEIEKLQEVAVLFSETLIDCVKRNLIKQDDIDEFQPIVMIAIPRLAIVRGLLYRGESPIYTRHKSQMCSLFQPFHGPLHSIRKLLRGLEKRDLLALERMLANDQSGNEERAKEPGCSSSSKSSTSSASSPSSPANQTKSSEPHDDQQQNISSACDCEPAGEHQAGTSNGNYSIVLMDDLQYPVGQKRRSLGEADDEELSTGGSKSLVAAIESGADQTHRSDYNCYLEVQHQASSSKDLDNADHHQTSQSPSHSTPSPSTSISSAAIECKKCASSSGRRGGQGQDGAGDLQNNQCDNDANCCLSPPESDAQLEKLIANFSPSMDDHNEQQFANETTTMTTIDSQPTTATTNKPTTARPTANDNQEAPSCQANSSSASEREEQSGKRQLQENIIKVKSEEEAYVEEMVRKQAQQLLHRLFVAISGVADQLQSNFASDLRFILRHIFSSEIAGDEDQDNCDDEEEEDGDRVHEHDDDEEEDDDQGEYSNNDHSDSSLPIEQGIEAQEIVANLIDLESGYSISDNSNIYGPTTTTTTTDNSIQYATGTPTGASRSGQPNAMAPSVASSDYPFMMNGSMHSPVVTDMNRYSSPTSSSVYVAAHHQHYLRQQQQQQQQSSANSRAFQDNLNEELNNELLADLMRASDQNELIHDTMSSPNDPSIMDDNQRRLHLLQQHVNSVIRIAATRSALQRSTNDPLDVGQQQQQHQAPAHHPRRHSRHHHGSSRSRRSRGPPVWVPDQLVVQCNSCNVAFTLFRRRHHCRACGQIFCADCSRFTKNLNCWGYNGPVRVCESCYNQPQQQAN